MSAKLKIKIQWFLDDAIALGPGKVELLEAIERQGSIAAAAREMGMSYRRAWLLVDTMNRCFLQPLVTATPGGASGAGARVTPEGSRVAAAYRAVERAAADAALAAEAGTIAPLLRTTVAGPVQRRTRRGTVRS
jgi:molybdate transport system regulatory protein